MPLPTHLIAPDSKWLRQMFAVEPGALQQYKKDARYRTTGYYKFTDTRPGGNMGINPPPQYCRYTDLKCINVFNNPELSAGLGRYYNDSQDDNARILYMRFGVSAPTPLLQFFSNFYDSDAARVVKTGNSGGIFYTAGKLSGFVITLPFQPLILAGRAINWFMGNSSTKFLSFKPTMPIYWNAVQTMANGIAANIGLTPRQFRDEIVVPDMSDPDSLDDSASVKYREFEIDPGAQTFSEYQKILPSIFRANGGIDVYSVANRAQRLNDAWMHGMGELAADKGLDTDEAWIAAMRGWPGKNHGELIKALNRNNTLESALARYFGTEPGKDLHDSEDKPATLKEYNNPGAMDYLASELRDGSQFIGYYIDSAETVSESFSNQVGDLEIGNIFNSTSSGIRKASINFGGGQSGIKPIDAAIGAAKEFMTGALEGLEMSGLIALAGNALVDIQKVWESSNASLPKLSYTIKLRSIYGNKLSRFIDLFLPLCGLIAGALPRSTGPQSFGTPFLVEAYDPGRGQTRMGIIDSMNITRGTGNIGWTKDNEFLGIDVTFSIIDLSSVMHMPIGSAAFGGSGITGLNRVFFGDDNAWTDYLATLSSLNLSDQIYKTRALARNWRRFKLDFDSFFSVSHAASWAVGTTPGRILSGFSNIGARG